MTADEHRITELEGQVSSLEAKLTEALYIIEQLSKLAAGDNVRQRSLRGMD